MKNWKKVTTVEDDRLWEFIYKDLRFNPRNERMDLILLPEPHGCFDTKWFLGEGFCEEYMDDLMEKYISYFKKLGNDNWYALEWQHETYSFNPNLPFEIDQFGEWFIPALPNGDYHFFLNKDLKNGIFGDGINHSICFYGEELLGIFQKNPPQIFAMGKR